MLYCKHTLKWVHSLTTGRKLVDHQNININLFFTFGRKRLSRRVEYMSCVHEKSSSSCCGMSSHSSTSIISKSQCGSARHSGTNSTPKLISQLFNWGQECRRVAPSSQLTSSRVSYKAHSERVSAVILKDRVWSVLQDGMVFSGIGREEFLQGSSSHTQLCCSTHKCISS